MTKDTERAMAIIKPFCEQLKIEVSADDKFLHIGETTHIGISGNSTYATLMEFVGYLFLNQYEGFRYDVSISAGDKEKIKRYFVNDAQYKRMFREGEE